MKDGLKEERKKLQEDRESKRQCPYCGMWNPDNSKYCKRCTYDFENHMRVGFK